jgi:hypothetical protein
MSNSTSLTGSSKQYIGVVDMLCEGPIYGLEKGKNDVYINDVPFENATTVGSLTDSGSARSLTLTPHTQYTMDVTNGTIKQTDVGKYAHIEAKKAGVTSISQTNYDQYTVTTITPSETLSTEWHNYQLDKYYTKLRNTVTGRVYNAYSYWSEATNVITLYSLPIRRGFGTASNWELVLIQSSRINNYYSDTRFGLGDSLHNHANLTDARFTISASVATNPDNPDPSATTSKVEGSTLQFRKGQLEQAPISQVHGVSGGVTKTGNTAGAQLKQYSDAVDLSNYKSGSPYSGISTFGYPTGQSYSDNSGPQLEFPSSAFGASTPEQVNEVNIRINYNSLILYNTENGDKEDAYAIYVFEVKTELNGEETPYKKLFSQYGTFIVHRGRTTAPVSFDHTIGLDRFKPFDDFTIRITRLTRDAGLPVRADGSNGGENDVDKWNLQAVSTTGGGNLSSTIQDSFIYPHTAIAAVSFSSKSYNQLPSRSYLLKGLMVEIPTAYTPREYSSTGVAEYGSWWDGSFKTELHYTDNPAWVFYDIATNARYGAGNWLESYNLDKFALYRIAKYCDELVDDGNGGTEPRFRANVYLAKATDVYKVLKDFASIFTGMLYWLDGKISPIQDVPGEPVYTFSKANVIDGRFNYESTGRKTRSNQVVVTWNDPTRNYEPVNLIVEDREDIVAQRKIVSQKAVAFGATSEGQAIRYGRWKLWTAQNQKEIVSFQTGLQGAYIRPGDVINVQDRDRYGIDFSGKIADVTTDNRLLLDRQITNITDPDGGAITYEISTLVTSYAAFYAGLNPLTLDGKTYQRGDRITGRVYLDTDGDGAGTSLTLGYINTEEKATNAFVNSSTPLPADWKPYSYVVTKDVTLNTSNGITAVSMASGESWYSAAEIPDEGTIFALVAKNSGDVNFLGSAKEYRVLGISFEESKNIYGISAVEHYNSKYDAVDKDYALGVIPDNTYADIEDPDAVVPAPGNIYVVSETDSSKPGEEFRIEWDVPQEEYTFLDESVSPAVTRTRERPYEFLNDYEIYHTIPDLDNPLFTANNSYRFQGVPDGIYTFRVRTRSRKGNTSDYVSVTYDVNDPFGTNVPRVVGGLPKGIVANSTAYDVHNSELTDEEDRYKLIWQRDSSARGYSIGNSMFGGTTGIATNLQGVGLFGLAVSGPLAETTVTTDARPDGYTGDEEWHYLHYDGSTSLSYWNTRTLDNVPFYHKIDTNGFGWRGSSQSWSYLWGGGYTTASVAAGSNRLVATSNGDFLSDLTIRDIVHFDGKAQTFEMYKIEQLREESGESVVSVHLREGKDVGDATDPGWVNGDIVTFERVGGATGVNGQYYYVKTTAADDRFQLYFDDGLTDPVRTAHLSGTYTTLTGFVTRAKVKAAKVVAVIDDNTAILDRSFSDAISVSKVYKLNYRPDYNDDAVFGRVKWNEYDNVDDIHTFTVDTFITVDEGLNVGALELTLIPSVSTIDYDGNDFSQETTFSGALTVNAIAAGFANPQFRITKVEGAGSLDFDMDADNLDIGWTNASGDAPQASLEVFSQSDANAIPYNNREPIIITGEVRESQNTGLNTTGTCQIAKVASGTDGIDGKTVEIRAEDNSIIYNEVGEEPQLNGAPDRTLTFTATARNYTTPEFKFTLESVNLYDDTEFVNSLAGNPGFGGSGTYSWGTFKIGDTEANPGVATATVTIPSTWDDKWAEEGDTKSKTFRVLVEVRESSADPITSTDITNITGVHSNDDGYAFVLTNPGNSIPCNEVGSVTYDTSTVTPVNGFVGVADTGTQIEVIKGGEVLSYVGPGSQANISDTTWANYTNTQRLGKYRVTYTESPDAAINRGALTYNESTKIITYGAHDFSVTGWEGESAVITYALQVENLDELIPLQQSFTKSKAGFGGLRAVLSNPVHELPTDPEGAAVNYARSGTSLNCFMTGRDLPYYSSGATIPDFVDVYWRHKSSNDTDITVGTRTEPTDGSTSPVIFGVASNITAEEAEIVFTIGVYIRRGNTFVEEEIEATQSFSKNRKGAYISVYASPQVYIYDGDDATQSPATNHRFYVKAFSGDSALGAFVKISSPDVSGTTTFTNQTGGIDGNASIVGTNNLSFRDSITGEINVWEYTAQLFAYEDRVTQNNVLAEDTVTIYGSFTQKDSIVMELTNDSDSVAWSGYDSNTTSAVSLSTTALIYKAGVEEDASDWSFSFSESSVDINGTSATNLITAAFDTTDTNRLDITAINKSFSTGTLTITAEHNAGEYDDHTAVFSIQRLFGTSILRITAEPGAVVKNPNTNTFTPSNRQVTYTVRRFEGLDSIELGTFYYNLNGGSTTEVQAGTNTSHTITHTFPTDADETDSSTLQVRRGSTSAAIHDIETVPVILGGEDGDAALGLTLSSDHQIFIKDVDGNLSPSSITITANRLNIPTTANSGPTISFSAVDQNNSAITLNTSGDTATLSDSNFGTSTSVTVTATVEFPANSGVFYTDTESIEVVQDGEVGADAITVSLSNDNHTFTANNDGSIPSGNFAGSGTTISVYEGATKLDYDGTGTSPGKWTVSRSNSTGVSSPSSFSGATGADGDDAIHGNVTAFTANTGTITYSISGEVADGTSFTAEKVKTLSKASKGDGGVDARTIVLTPSKHVISYDTAGSSGSQQINFTTSTTGVEDTAYYVWKVDGTTKQNGLGGTNLPTFTLANADEPGIGESVRVSVELYEGTTVLNASNAGEKAQDTVTIHAVQDGSDALIGFLTNSNHSVPSENNGTGYSLTGAGGEFRVFKGGTELTSGVTYSGSTTKSNLSLNINSGTGVYTLSGNSWNSNLETFTLTATIAAATAGTASNVTITQIYSISKSRKGDTGTGTTGDDGPRYLSGIVYATTNAAKPTNATYNFNNNTFSGLGSWSKTPPTQSTSQAVIYYLYFYVEENISSGTGTGSGSVVFPGSAFQGTSFANLVVFQPDGSTSNYLREVGASQNTTINGGAIATGTIDAQQIRVSNNSSGSAGIYLDANPVSGTDRPRIDIRDSSGLRVRLGYLN